MFMMRKYLNFSDPEIGSKIDRKDHAATMLGCNKVKGLKNKDKKISKNMEKIEKAIQIIKKNNHDSYLKTKKAKEEKWIEIGKFWEKGFSYKEICLKFEITEKRIQKLIDKVIEHKFRSAELANSLPSRKNFKNYYSECKKIREKNQKENQKISSFRKNNLDKIFAEIKEYNIKCKKGISFQTLILLLGNSFGEDTTEKYIRKLLSENKIKQKYGNYIAVD
jgi:hypothetical protein